jgi:tellurium resistance protein TerD
MCDCPICRQQNFNDLTEDFSACASVEFCRLYRYNGAWKVQATGIAHKGGLEELVSKYM